MKKLLLLLFLIPNLVMAETWVCVSSTHPLKDQGTLSKYERQGNYFVHKSFFAKYKIDIENEKKIYATSVSDTSYWVLSLDKEKKIQQKINMTSGAVYEWRGDCEVVE